MTNHWPGSRTCWAAWLAGACVFRAVPAYAWHAPATLPAVPAARDSTRAATWRVTGVVRDAETDEPVRGVRIEVVGTPTASGTDRDGTYALELAPGAHTLRFTHTHYRPLTLVVLVGDARPSVVDVGLEPAPSTLPALRVRATPSIGADAIADAAAHAIPTRTADGGTAWSSAAMQGAPQLDQGDVLHLVETAATSATQSEAPQGLHVTGGLADQNLVLLDGIPIANAVHNGALSSAIDPAALATTTFYDDHMPARFGGRLGGVLDLHTRGPSALGSDDRAVDPLRFEGFAAYGGVGLIATAEAPASGASGLVSVRHSPLKLRSFWQPRFDQVTDIAYGAGWSDVLARGGVPLAGGTLAALAFRSRDVVGFSEIRFAWGSTAAGVRWTGPVAASGTTLDVRAWRSTTTVLERWASLTGGAALTNGLVHRGLAADLRTDHHTVTAHVGGAVERLRTSYVTSSTSYVTSSWYTATQQAAPLTLDGAALRASLYADVAWHPSGQWTVFPGVRATTDRTDGGKTVVRLEPRLGAEMALTPQLRAAAFYTGTTQPLQSLRNEESVFEGVAAVDLMSVHNDTVLMAASRLASATLTFAASPAMTIVLGAYRRTSSHLVMVPTSTVAPFVVDSVSTGSGRSTGWYLTATRATRRLVVDAAVRSSSAWLRSTEGDVAYRPGFSTQWATSLAARYQVAQRTDLRTSFDAAVGRRGALERGRLFLGWHDQVSGNRLIGGAVEATAPGSVALPAYMRLNVGVSHEIVRPSAVRRCDAARGGRDASAAAPSCGTPAALLFVAVDNVLDRDNPGVLVDQLADPPSAQGPHRFDLLTLRPRKLVAGVRWWW